MFQMILAIDITDEGGFSNKGKSWGPVKRDKGDVAVYFIRIGILKLVHQQQGGALQLVKETQSALSHM